MWAWPAIVGTHALRQDSQNKPTKELTAGKGRPKRTCTLPKWWILQEGARCVTGSGEMRGQQGRFRQVSASFMKTWCQMGSAGIPFTGRERVGLGKGKKGGKWGRAGHSSSAEGESEKGKSRRGDLNREVGLRETKKTPAHQMEKHRGCQRTSRLSNEWKNTHESLSLTFEPEQPRSSVCLPGFISQIHLSVLSSAAFSRLPCVCRQWGGCSMNDEMSATSLMHDAPSSLWRIYLVFKWFQQADVHAAVTSAWLTSLNLQVCCFSGNQINSSVQCFTLTSICKIIQDKACIFLNASFAIYHIYMQISDTNRI